MSKNSRIAVVRVLLNSIMLDLTRHTDETDSVLNGTLPEARTGDRLTLPPVLTE